MREERRMTGPRWLRPMLTALVLGFVISQSLLASSFTLFGSYYAPDDTDETIGLATQYTIRFVDKDWAVDLGSGFYDGVEVALDTGVGVVDDELRIVPLDLGLRYTVNRTGPQPYFGAGASFVRLNSDAGDVEEVWGWYGLAGVAFGDRRGPKLVIEGVYRGLDDAVITLDPNLPESSQPTVSLSGLAVNLGVSWTL